MGYFDEEENKAQESSDEMSALAEGVMSKEERAAEKARLKEEKQREKELRQREKMEKKLEKKKAKGLFTGDIEDKMSGLAKPGDNKEEAADKASEKIETELKAEAAAAAEQISAVEQSKPESVAEAAAEAVSEAVTSSEASAESEGDKTSEQYAELESGKDEEESDKKKKKRSRKSKGKDGKPEEVNIVRDLLSLIIYIGIVILICFLIITYVGRRTAVHGDSMEPTLQNGDSVWVNMLGYRFSDPDRYDIIVFPYDDDVNYIKRIIGLPGETIQITSNGDILINGKVLQEPKQFDRMVTSGTATEPITLGPDEYFVLGDNRTNSKDSRWPEVGNIKRDKIIGKAVFRLTPLKKFGKIE